MNERHGGCALADVLPAGDQQVELEIWSQVCQVNWSVRSSDHGSDANSDRDRSCFRSPTLNRDRSSAPRWSSVKPYGAPRLVTATFVQAK